MAAILLQRCSASKQAGHCQNYVPCAQLVHTRGRVTATYPWDMYPQHFHVCKCCDFVPATCPCYTSLLHVASVCTTQVFVAAACRCDMSLQHDPSRLPTLMPKWHTRPQNYFGLLNSFVNFFMYIIIDNHGFFVQLGINLHSCVF